MASAFSLRYWGRKQFALTSEHALMLAGTARNPSEAAIALGQAGWAREQLESSASKTPFEGFRIVGRDKKVAMSSRPDEEGVRRPGPPLPDPWDIPPEGLVVGGRGQAVYSAVVPFSGVSGIGARADLELSIFSTKALGTGLGLPLVARGVTAHGGSVAVESEVRKGTMFHLELSAKEATWLASAS